MLSLTLQKMSLESFYKVFQLLGLDILSPLVIKNPSEHHGLNTNHNSSFESLKMLDIDFNWRLL